MQNIKFDHLASLGLLTMGSLAFEIALTRLLSTLFYPPFVYIVLSIAILGIGLGAAIATWRDDWRKESRVPVYMTLAGISALLLTVFAILTASISLAPLLIVLMILPYGFTGLAITSLFSNAPDNSRLLYAADLIGAGLGAILVIPLMNAFGVVNSLLLLAAVFSIAAMLYEENRFALLITIIGAILYGSNLFGGWLNIDMVNLTSQKPIHEALINGGYIIETRNDSFARTDLVQPPQGQPPRIYVDGAAASVMPPASNNDYLKRDIGLFAFATAQPQRVFAIGTGGGLDVWFGLQVGAEEIIAVEVNPQSVALVQDYGRFNSGIYDNSRVTIHVDEGRSVLQRDNSDYDLIFLSQVVTLAAERTGYSLTENAVFTVEAFQAYREHLTPEGYITLKLYDEYTATRALSIAMEMFKAEGLSDIEALQHIIVLLDPSTSPATPLLMIRNTPFLEEESAAIGSAAQHLNFAALYLPGIQSSPPLDAIELNVRSYDEVVADSTLDISAPTDNRPFFYQSERGIPSDLYPLLITLGIILIIGFVLLLVVYQRHHPTNYWPTLLYFSGLGIGFMMVEITVIQQTRLYIGHPTLAITAVLATLLIGGGLGSGLYRFLVPELSTKSIMIALFLLIAILAIWAIGWPMLSDSTFSLAPVGRIFVAALSILPLALFMGIPFAAGLGLVGNYSNRYVAFAWCVNGLMTVVGSVLAIVLAILWGYIAVLVLGAIFYGLSLLAARQL